MKKHYNDLISYIFLVAFLIFFQNFCFVFKFSKENYFKKEIPPHQMLRNNMEKQYLREELDEIKFYNF